MQSEHDGSDVQEAFNIERQHGRDFIPNMTRDSRLKYITFYEDGESIPGKRTAVWELDKGTLSQMFSLLAYSFHYEAVSMFLVLVLLVENLFSFSLG